MKVSEIAYPYDMNDVKFEIAFGGVTYTLTRKFVKKSTTENTNYYKFDIKPNKIQIGACAVLGFSREYWLDIAALESERGLFMTESDWDSYFFTESPKAEVDFLCLFPYDLTYFFNKNSTNSLKICFVKIEDAFKEKKIIKITLKSKDDLRDFFKQMERFEACKSFATFKTLILIEQLEGLHQQPSGEKLREFLDKQLTPAYEKSLSQNKEKHNELGLPTMYQRVCAMV